MGEVLRKTSFMIMGRRIQAPLHVCQIMHFIYHKYGMEEERAYSDRGMSFEFAGETKTSDVRAMLEHAFWTSCRARSDHSLVMAVVTLGRTYVYGR